MTFIDIHPGGKRAGSAEHAPQGLRDLGGPGRRDSRSKTTTKLPPKTLIKTKRMIPIHARMGEILPKRVWPPPLHASSRTKAAGR